MTRKKLIMSKKHIIAIAALSTLVAAPVLAQDLKAGDLLVRARAVHLNSANKDSTGLDLSVNNKWLPEVDFTYFLSPNLATELILTVPQKHTLSAGSAEIGTLKHLPPTLSLQYHFPAGPVKPYVGAGLNYTRFSSVKLPAGVDIKRNSVAKAQKDSIDDSLFRLERSALLALSQSQGEANIRVREAELTQKFVERARLIQPLGRVVTARDQRQRNVVLESDDIIVIPPRTNVIRISGEVMMTQAVMWRPSAKAPFVGSKSSQPASGSHTANHACDASAPTSRSLPGGGTVSR